MKKIFTSIALVFSAVVSNAQSTATNWTAVDCNGLSHTLFNELDSGKVIVFAWVMPCGTCVTPSKTAYDAVQSFATSHPGKVRFYLSDDFGDATCSTLNNWVTSNGIGSLSNMKVFSNSGLAIDENNFGGTGMPHIIVMGGTSHTIFFNKKNSASNDATGITNAINSAIGATTVNELINPMVFSVSPNPAQSHFSISCKSAIRKISVTAINGQVVCELTFPAGKMNPEIDLSQQANGLYFIKVIDLDDKQGVQKVVKQ